MVALEMVQQAATGLHEGLRKLPRQEQDRDLRFLQDEVGHMPHMARMLQERIGLLIEADEDRCRTAAADLLRNILIEDDATTVEAAVSRPAKKTEEPALGRHNPFYDRRP
jgi:hypothetical protein